MKSKMKTTFAIIAVALMVMVAVVPMIGVFTSNSDAATPIIVDPLPTTDGITINAVVMDADGEYVDNVYILVIYGENSEYKFVSDATDDGKVTFIIDDDYATGAVAYVVNDLGLPKSGFVSKPLGNLVGGETYNVNFIKGEKAVELTFNAIKSGNNWVTIDELLGDAIVTVDYSLYSEDSYKSSKLISSGTALVIDGEAAITYGASLTKAFLQIDKFTYITADLEVNTLLMSIQAGDMLDENFKADEVITGAYHFLRVDVDNIVNLGLMDVTLSDIKDDSETPVSIDAKKFTALTSNKVENNSGIYYYYPVSDSYGFVDSLKVKLTITKDIAIQSPVIEEAYSEGKNVSVATIQDDYFDEVAFYGAFAMEEIPAYTGQPLVIKLATYNEQSQTYTPGKALNVYVYEGNYIAIGATEETYLQIIADGFVLSTIGTAVQPPTINKDGYTSAAIALGKQPIAVDSTGYELVNYSVVMHDGNNTTEITEALELTISDVSSAFGYAVAKDNTVTLMTSEAGTYSLYVKKMDCITFSLANDVEFESGMAGPWIVGKTAPANDELVIAPTYVAFEFIDGDGEELLQDVTITFPITSTLYGIFEGNSVVAEYNIVTGLFEFELDASYISPVGAEFIPTAAEYNFPEEAMVYAYDIGLDYMTVVSLDETYSLYLEDAYGNVVVSEDSLFKYYLAKAMINESGVYTITPVNPAADPIEVGATDKTGKVSLVLRSDYAENEVAPYSNYSYVYVLKPNTDSYILRPYYLFSPDDGIMVVEADADSISGIVTKSNGTPITGALIEVYTESGEPAVKTVYASAVTSSEEGKEGTYTLYCAEDMSGIQNAKVGITKAGYTFANDITPGDLEFVEGLIVSETDPFIINIKEADGSYYTPVVGNILTLKAGVVTEAISATVKTFKVSASFEVGEKITPTMNNNTRTFTTYTITDEDITSGIITVTTEQIVYLVSFADYNEETLDVSAIEGATVKFYAYSDGNYTEKAVVDAQDTAKIGTKYYAKAYALDVLEAPYTDYAISVTLAGTAAKYNFDGSKVFMDEDDVTVVESTSAKVFVFAKDYFGNILTLSAGEQETKVPTINGVETTIILGGLQFIQDYSKKSLTITWNNTVVTDNMGVGNRAAYFGNAATYDYSVSKGTITAPNGLYEVKAFNAVGDLITKVGETNLTDVKITGYTLEGSTILKTAGAHSVNFKDYTIDPFVAVGDEFVTYTFESAALENAGYSFDPSESTTFMSNEASFTAAFFDLRGIEVAAPTTYVFAALDEDGDVIEAVDTGETIFIDADSVAMFSVFVKTENANNQYFKTNETYLSLTGDFVSPYTKITGSLPVATDSSNDYVSVDLLLNGVVVDTQICIPGAGQNQYTVYIDLTGETDALAGVPFDSITATYVYRGSVYATVLVDPTAAVNPIVVEPETLYDITLTGSDFILEHLSKKVVGNVAYLTADSMFEIVVQTTQVEGKQMVEKYTFAGWYVNGKAVNASEPTISVELTQTANSASAKYNVEIYEVVEPTPEPTPTPTVDNSIDPTVLVIGICAVIVALIAVAYAVISSRPKEKKE